MREQGQKGLERPISANLAKREGSLGNLGAIAPGQPWYEGFESSNVVPFGELECRYEGGGWVPAVGDTR
jgi:hypothetical protein